MPVRGWGGGEEGRDGAGKRGWQEGRGEEGVRGGGCWRERGSHRASGAGGAGPKAGSANSFCSPQPPGIAPWDGRKSLPWDSTRIARMSPEGREPDPHTCPASWVWHRSAGLLRELLPRSFHLSIEGLTVFLPSRTGMCGAGRVGASLQEQFPSGTSKISACSLLAVSPYITIPKKSLWLRKFPACFSRPRACF